MANLSIGISGLQAAQKALDVIGNNLANAATPGYHRQRLNLTPAYSTMSGPSVIGGGVESSSITRMVDRLLDKEILRQESTLEQLSQELVTLQSVENAFGEISSDTGLNKAIDNFYASLADLSNHAGESIWQRQVVTDAETLASQFRTLGDFLSKLDAQIRIEAEHYVESANTLINQIASLNDSIEKMELQGSMANNMRDERDQLISELSLIIGAEVVDREHGLVDVEAAGIAVVISTSPTELEVGVMENGNLGISIKNALNYNQYVQGGKLGALLNLKNTVLSDITQDLDNLAKSFICEFNKYHIQGLGPHGSFTNLDGWSMETEVLADMDPPITSGKFYIRLTDTATQTITRHEIDLSTIVPADPLVGLTLTDVAAEITTIPGLNSYYDPGGLHIDQTAANYKFDFLPAVLPIPTSSVLTGGSPPSITISGIYDGSENDSFNFDISGAGSVGNGALTLTVRNGAGQVVKTLNIGDGYAAGDVLSVGNGINIAVGVGDFGAGDNFDVDAFADTDTSDLISAAGLNCFFSGKQAKDIGVCDDIANDPTRLATSLGADLTDNTNISRLRDLQEQSIGDLGGMTTGTFYRKIVVDIGQQLNVRQMRQKNLEVVVQNLNNQRNEVSGVDINEEAAQLMIYEQMFQAMARFMRTVQTTLDSIMSIV